MEDVRLIRAAKFTASKQPSPSSSSAATAPRPTSMSDPTQGTCTGPRPSRVDWGGTDWLWAHAPTTQDTKDTQDTQDTEQVVEKLFTRYNDGVGCKSVAKGALGSRQLYDLAKELVQSPDHPRASRSGKWLLTIQEGDVDRMWGIVQRGVQAELLGPLAKVGPIGKVFLICVYTQDFTDDKDILRVLQQLVGLKLLRENKAIAYKADVITKLAIKVSRGSSTSVENGTFYQGSLRGSEVVFEAPTHFNCKGGNGRKVNIPS